MNKTSNVALLADRPRSPFSCISGERRNNLLRTRSEPRLKDTRENEARGARGPDPFACRMIKPQQPVELPVFGKPWFWQRRGSTMESARGLARVIMEMRDEIKKLEAENRELRGDPSTSPGEAGSPSAATGRRDGAEENPYLNLRRNASAPVLEQQYKENTTMTVRRYSISANVSDTRTERPGGRRDSGWGRLQEEVQHGKSIFGEPAEGEVGKQSNRRSLQEYVHKNRAKVKTVTFLLPVDDIYTSRPVLTKHQEEPTFHELASVTETDS